jgi:hypothetical protein
VRVGAAAILDGSIDPIDTDSTEADYMQIYLHNNIFYSAATGMKENFLVGNFNSIFISCAYVCLCLCIVNFMTCITFLSLFYDFSM